MTEATEKLATTELASNSKAAAAHQKDIPSLDGIRAVAVMIVFIAHAGLGKIVPGGFGVTIFFFLSGYLITTLFVREQEKYGSVSLKAFFLRRLTRLSPPLFVTLLFAYGLMAFGLIGGQFHLGNLLSQTFYFSNYFMLYGGAVKLMPEGTEILWSLAVEEHFYLFYPFVFVGLVKLKSAEARIGVLLGAVLAVLLWRYFLHYGLNAGASHPYYSTDTRIDSILYGCLLAALAWGGYADRLLPQKAMGAGAVTLGCLALLLVTFLYRDPAFRNTLRYSIQGIALLPLFYYAVKFPTALHHRILNTGVMMRIGVYSYTMYLCHFVILKLLDKLAFFNGNFLAKFIVGLVISIIYSAVMYRFVEEPMGRLRRRLRGH